MNKVVTEICRLTEHDVRQAVVEYVNKKYGTKFNSGDVTFYELKNTCTAEVSKRR